MDDAGIEEVARQFQAENDLEVGMLSSALSKAKAQTSYGMYCCWPLFQQPSLVFNHSF